MSASLPTVDSVISLVQAMVTTSDTPLLLLDGDLAIVAASKSLCRAFDLDAATLPGLPIFAMGAGEWDNPRLRSLLGAVVSGGAEIDTYEMDLVRGQGRSTRALELSAHKLDYSDLDNVRLLLSVADRTEARAADKQKQALAAEKILLIQELNHRVANSLQIIASVLMQSARRVSSDETRIHLEQAHNRVLSVAAIQKQLAVTGDADVALSPYFHQLCASIGASMIPDRDKLSIRLEIDDSVVAADISVSLGLIVTELVINALKHGYPDNRAGVIIVGYHGDDDGWTLQIDDDGVGMPAVRSDAKPGLGTSIVEALARQLGARITVTPAHPGTSVSLTHERAGKTDAEVLPLVRAV